MSEIKKRRTKTETELKLEKFWGEKAKANIKAKMALNQVSSIQLTEMLTQSGRISDLQGVRNMLSVGKFKASWYLHVLHLLDEYEKKESASGGQA
ncbi:MAG: DUF6471 domain-containing protein [Methylococcales bacterium]